MADRLDSALWTCDGREATFNTETQVSDDPNARAMSWPHERPLPSDLAKAGFFYSPLADSSDNCECFRCAVRLDAWDPDDDPLKEHYQHRSTCDWARLVSRKEDPSDPSMLAARVETFGARWPHEGKSGWKCTIYNMAAAGWTYDPSADAKDAVRCWHCETGLDTFEQEDDPYDEHFRRAPKCHFFTMTKKRNKKPRGKGTRSSKASRMSTQSMQSTFSDAPSFMSLGDASEVIGTEQSVVGVDDSTMAAGKPKGRKPPAKRVAKTSTKDKKGTRAGSMEPSTLDSAMDAYRAVDQTADMSHVNFAAETSVIPDVKMANDTVIDSSSQKETKTRATRAKPKPRVKATAAAEAIVEPVVGPAAIVQDMTRARSESMHSALEERIRSPSPPKRGTKRTSTGAEKQPELSESEATDSTRPRRNARSTAKKASAPTTKVRQRKTKNDANETINEEVASQIDAAPARATRGKRTKTGTEASQIEVSDLSKSMVEKAPRTAAAARELPAVPVAAPALAQERAPAAMSSPQSQHGSDAENLPPAMSSAARGRAELGGLKSPQSRAQSQAQFAEQPIYMSPTKTTRVPLAASTPIKAAQNVERLRSDVQWVPTDIEMALLMSPEPESGSGEIRDGSGNTSIEERLLEVGGQLSSAEKRMTLEEWIRSRAAKAEERLRHEGERMVAMFENEGAKAMQVIAGLQVNKAA